MRRGDGVVALVCSRSMAPDPYQRFRRARYFSSLDGLRCLSIVPIVWHHSCPSAPAGLLGKGPSGVQLFFAISGFLITTLLLRERSDTGRIALGRFYLRRSLRIFPLYFAVLALVTCFTWLAAQPGPQREHFFESLPFYVTYTCNWFVDWEAPHPITFAFAWSLATEEQFYLVWPWALRWSRGTLVPAACMLVALLFDQAAEGLWPLAFPNGELRTTMASSISSAIGLGSVGAILLHSRRGFAWAWRVLGHRFSAPVLLALVFAELYANRVPHLAFHLTLAALVGACVIREDHGLARWLDATWPAHVGKVSYGMYLLHVGVIAGVRAALPGAGPALVFGVALPVSVVLATWVYRRFEMPIRRLADLPVAKLSAAVTRA